MSIVALNRRMHRMDRGRDRWRGDLSQMPDSELHALIVHEVRKTDPALADRVRAATGEELEALYRQIAAGELP